MIILHAAFHDSQLHFWGETPRESTATNKRNAKAPSAKPLPYDAGPQALPVGVGAHAASQNERRSKKKPTLEELTVRSFRLAYEQHHRKSA